MNKKQVLEEIEKIMYSCYGLNKIIRYKKNRAENLTTQSVAEHVANMLYLAFYFRDKVEIGKDLDWTKVTEIILTHDMGEIETGDFLTTEKTKQQSEDEMAALDLVALKSPEFVSQNLKNNVTSFEYLSSKEAVYVRAIDKFEGYMYWFDDRGIAMIKTVHPADRFIEIVDKYIKERVEFFNKHNFPIMAIFFEIMFEDQKLRGLYK